MNSLRQCFLLLILLMLAPLLGLTVNSSLADSKELTWLPVTQIYKNYMADPFNNTFSANRVFFSDTNLCPPLVIQDVNAPVQVGE